MKFCKFISFLFLLLLVQENVKAQDVDTVNYLNYNEETFYEDESEDYQPSDEELILQDESDQAREFVLKTEDLLNYALSLEENDSLTFRYALYKNSETLVEFNKQVSSFDDLEKRFDIVKSLGDYNFFYCIISDFLINTITANYEINLLIYDTSYTNAWTACLALSP